MRILILIFAGFCITAGAQTNKNKNVSNAAKNAAPVSSTPAGEGKIGYVDIDRVISQLPEYKQMETKLTETRKKKRDEYFQKQQDFDLAYQQYKQNSSDLADTTRTRIEGNLQAMSTELQQFPQDAENTFENTKKLFLGPVYLKLGRVIHDVAVENGFSMILPYRIGNADLLLHSDTTLDVSELVVKKFSAK